MATVPSTPGDLPANSIWQQIGMWLANQFNMPRPDWPPVGPRPMMPLPNLLPGATYPPVNEPRPPTGVGPSLGLPTPDYPPINEPRPAPVFPAPPVDPNVVPSALGSVPLGSVPSEPTWLEYMKRRIQDPDVQEKFFSQWPDFIKGPLGIKDPNKEKAAAFRDYNATLAEERNKKWLEALNAPQPTAKFEIPGTGKAYPKLSLPAMPDFTAAREALMRSAPTPPEPMTEHEARTGILASAAAGAARGQTVGQVLALAGAGAAGARAETQDLDRKRRDLYSAHQREFYRQIAEFERDEAKTKYQIEYQQAVLQHNRSADEWKLLKPEFDVTKDGSIVVSRLSPDGGRTIEVIPGNAGILAGELGNNARKGAGYVGGLPYMADLRTTVAAFGQGEAAQRMGIEFWRAQQLLRAGLVVIPDDSSEESKKRDYAVNQRALGKANLSDSNQIMRDAAKEATNRLQALGYTRTDDKYPQYYMSALAMAIARRTLEDPELSNRVAALVHGTNYGK